MNIQGEPIRLAINGAAGRMGKRLVALASEDIELQVASALEYGGHPDLGQDAGPPSGIAEIGVLLSEKLTEEIDAVIDFSTPAGADAAIKLCLSQRIPLVMATTGLSVEQEGELQEAAKTIPVVWAPNFSLAVNLTMKLTEIASRTLRNQAGGVDVEIIERHHRFKEDAPSGTALKFGEIIAREMGQTKHLHGREGRPGARSREEIGYHALRTGDNPGEHTIVFGLLGETIDLKVAATNRDSYAMGALAAAKFIATRPPGLYGMAEVLGF